MTDQRPATILLELRARIEALEAHYETQRLATLAWGKDVDKHSRWNDGHLKRIMALETERQPPQDRRDRFIMLGCDTPEAASVAEVSDALIKMECALSDIAEGEETNATPNTFEWAERRCAETLAIVRPVMQQHGIRTSEWPAPAPAPSPSPPPTAALVERVARAIHPSICADPNIYQHEARAAIREVAAALIDWHDSDQVVRTAWEAAKWLEQQADQ
jgi:hypothetical protein